MQAHTMLSCRLSIPCMTGRAIWEIFSSRVAVLRNHTINSVFLTNIIMGPLKPGIFVTLLDGAVGSTAGFRKTTTCLNTSHVVHTFPTVQRYFAPINTGHGIKHLFLLGKTWQDMHS